MAETHSYESADSETRELIDRAEAARANAYCPYSKFHVGAALRCQDGTMFTGSNVENASYGLTVCAERVVVMTAAAKGHRKFTAIAVCCDIKDSFKASCGACRQVMAEFGLDLMLYMVKPDKTWACVQLRSLMPMAFLPSSLDEERSSK